MNILIIATRDKRKRHNFLFEPISQINSLKVNIFNKETNLINYLINSFLYALANKNVNYVIVCGGNFTGLVWLVLSKIVMKSKFVVRLGGDTLENKIRKIRANEHISFLEYIILRLNHFFTKIIFYYTDSIVVVNPYLISKIKKKLRRNIPISVIQQPAIIRDLKGVTSNKLNKSFKLLTVSNFSYNDKYEGVKSILKHITSKYINHKYSFKIVYDIVGGGVYVEELKNYLNKFNINSNKIQINIWGYINDLNSFYKNADAFVYCSTLDGLPNVLLEAQSYGLPLIVNRYEPFYSFLEENKNVLFFDKNNVEEFYQKVNLIIKDSYLREKMMHNNLWNIKSNYSVNVIAKKWETFFKAKKYS